MLVIGEQFLVRLVGGFYWVFCPDQRIYISDRRDSTRHRLLRISCQLFGPDKFDRISWSSAYTTTHFRFVHVPKSRIFGKKGACALCMAAHCCRLMAFVAYGVCRIMAFVTDWVRRIMTFVAYGVCRSALFLQCYFLNIPPQWQKSLQNLVVYSL